MLVRQLVHERGTGGRHSNVLADDRKCVGLNYELFASKLTAQSDFYYGAVVIFGLLTDESVE